MAEPASDRRVAAADEPSPDALIRPPDAIFDVARTRGELEVAATCGLGETERRREAVRVLQDALARGREAIASAFKAGPRDARPAVSSYAWLADRIVQAAYELATRLLRPVPIPTEAERVAVLAVGGYGRAEMAPFSDVDLLFLTPRKMSPWAESVIESMLYVLWDLHLKVGHSSRAVGDCLRLGREDHTIRTSLLEMRRVDGDAALARELRERVRKDLFGSAARGFIEAKLAERTERHGRQGGQRYMVEPNVKEGKGGLRDLHSLFWIDKCVHGVGDTAELVERGLFRKEEHAAFLEAENFLMAVRCHLHLIAGRVADRLTFDMQVQVAERMGYADGDGRRAVEHFMQDYFRHATRVGDLTRIFLTELEARHLKREPRPTGAARLRRPKRGYRVESGRLTIAEEKEFLADKLNLLRVFDEALRTGYKIHPDAMRLVSANLNLIDAEMRSDPEANRIFLDLLIRRGNPERALRRMNELGALAAFIPEFAPVVAMMQFNMYHAYTVDEHTIQCIANIARIERGELAEELPVASRILREGANRKTLYVAALCHDIGKGRDEDHSALGARIARRLAPRLGLNPEECETVEWLVRHHLLMSDMAQKRDVSDPRTARDFAKAVKSRARLDLLAVLTVCDIRGVGPGAWNNWKAQLLSSLHELAASALVGGLEAVNREAREDEAKSTLRGALADWDADDVRAELRRHYGPYWQGMPAAAQAVFARLLRGVGADEIRVDVMPDNERDATRVCFAMQDHPGIFSRLAGALALAGANVVDARTYTSKDGYATAAFWIQDAEGTPFEEERLPRLRDLIGKTLRGEVVAREALKDRDRFGKRERAFRVPTSISFDNEGSDIYTIVEVDTRDRPGLLHDLTRALADSNVQIASAVIATYGAQAVDSFYVKDMFGLKLHAESRRRSLERKLREAIERGAERARA